MTELQRPTSRRDYSPQQRRFTTVFQAILLGEEGTAAAYTYCGNCADEARTCRIEVRIRTGDEAELYHAIGAAFLGHYDALHDDVL